MTSDHTALPWETLKEIGAEIPWLALGQFADALVKDPALIRNLESIYDEARAVCAETPTLADLYVAAILVLAASRLGTERRRELAPLIVQKLMEAGETDDDGAIAVLTATCGTLGSDCLPAVLDALSAKKERRGAWFSLWSLMKLGAKSTEPAIRERVTKEAMKLLREADSGQAEAVDAFGAAHVLAEMKHEPCRPLLQRLAARRGAPFLGPGEFREALACLDGRSKYEHLPELWDKPVREWFKTYWQMAKDSYKTTAEEDDEGDSEEEQEKAANRRIRVLIGRFLDSPFAAQLPGVRREQADFIADCVLRHARDHVGADPEDLDEQALREVLLEVLPSKITAGREMFEQVAPVIQALLRWFGSEGILQNSEALAAAVGRWADKIVTEGMNPRNWGMAKSFAMSAQAEGVDITDTEAMRHHMAEYNLRMLEQQTARKRILDEQPQAAEIKAPDAPSVGRNDPCPCGSGKKYKKCCGAAGAKTPAPPARPVADADSPARRIAHELTDKMLDACKRFVPTEEIHAALHCWTGTTDAVLDGDREEQGMFFEYLLYDWRPDDGRGKTVLERFAETQSARLSPEEHIQLEAWLHKRRRGLFEVEDVSPATHLTTLRDRFVGDAVQVFDVSLSRKAHRGNLFMTAVFPCGDRLEIGGFASVVPRHMRIPFEAWLRREYAEWRARRQVPDVPASWSRFFSERCPEIERKVKTIGDVPPVMVLTTGEPCAYGYAVYSVSDHAAVLKALNASPFLRPRGFGKGNEVEGDYFGWPREQGTAPLPFERPVPDMDEDGRRVLVFQSSWVNPDKVGKIPTRGQDEDIASIYLGKNALEILAMSKERLEYVRPILGAALGPAVALRRSKQMSSNLIDEMWKKRGQRRPEEWTSPRDAELKSIGRKAMEEYWREWIDHPIKALKGKTPREAATDPRLRQELEALLLDIEEDTRAASGRRWWSEGFADNVRRELRMP